MLNPFMLGELNKFLEYDSTIAELKKNLISIKDGLQYQGSEFSTSFGHSLSIYEINRLELALTKSKNTESLGTYLKSLATEKGITSVNDGTFGEAVITKSYWSRLINDYFNVHDKNKLLRISIFLKLSLKETLTLLNKAGFTLSEDNIRDIIITFFINEQKYDLSDLEEILKEKGMRSLYTNFR
jgi:hypothetical protein